ncbi:hypothetical protein M5K25_005752 [Dendrobium thyrsiflorum]|uniref:Uncharacterized protein n=1 Tax=Dendrobium thyrsiflorum TaxID=117978 RepID=A0ABD0VQY2_DENTH
MLVEKVSGPTLTCEDFSSSFLAANQTVIIGSVELVRMNRTLVLKQVGENRTPGKQQTHASGSIGHVDGQQDDISYVLNFLRVGLRFTDVLASLLGLRPSRLFLPPPTIIRLLVFFMDIVPFEENNNGNNNIDSHGISPSPDNANDFVVNEALSPNRDPVEHRLGDNLEKVTSGDIDERFLASVDAHVIFSNCLDVLNMVHIINISISPISDEVIINLDGGKHLLNLNYIDPIDHSDWICSQSGDHYGDGRNNDGISNILMEDSNLNVVQVDNDAFTMFSGKKGKKNKNKGFKVSVGRSTRSKAHSCSSIG